VPHLVLEASTGAPLPEIADLNADLQKLVYGVPFLKVPDLSNVRVTFPICASVPGVPPHMLCTMPGLFITPERTPARLQALAEAVLAVLFTYASRHVPEFSVIEVNSVYNPDGARGRLGYASCINPTGAIPSGVRAALDEIELWLNRAKAQLAGATVPDEVRFWRGHWEKLGELKEHFS
jgi:hypothetical protein